MVELISVLRWIHELAAIIWFGEVFVVTHIIAPTLHRLPDSPKGLVMLKLYPRIFRMATISSSTTIASGAIVALLEARFDYSYFLTTFRGQLILVGGLIGLFMFLLHTTVERVEMKALSGSRAESQGELPRGAQGPGPSSQSSATGRIHSANDSLSPDDLRVPWDLSQRL